MLLWYLMVSYVFYGMVRYGFAWELYVMVCNVVQGNVHAYQHTLMNLHIRSYFGSSPRLNTCWTFFLVYFWQVPGHRPQDTKPLVPAGETQGHTYARMVLLPLGSHLLPKALWQRGGPEVQQQ